VKTADERVGGSVTKGDFLDLRFARSERRMENAPASESHNLDSNP
jgi:hypothetical protein